MATLEGLALAHSQFRRADAAALARAEQALVRAQELTDETSARADQPEAHECRAQVARLAKEMGGHAGTLPGSQGARHAVQWVRT